MTATGCAFAGHGLHATEQFRCLSAAYDPITPARLGQTGVRKGRRCLEVGAGGGSVAQWLARRSGSVPATDLDPRHVPAEPGLTVRRHDVVRELLPEGGFDLVHARFVPAHLPEREEVLCKPVLSLKPGGWSQIDEFDRTCAPVLVDVDPVPVTQPWRAGSPAVRLLAHRTHLLRDGLVEAGMTDQDLHRLRALPADPVLRVASCVRYSVHGRRP
ncbi:methyltransferase domain-containing protein [Actinosynnema sp. NPDC047251]|uniref:class I SAM-dependent methyltransferase n=1 Tax=Saccharothrix espanaensis TaxID=103731 RepID=UPI0002DCE75F|nr:methyltransferase domain-containing protein [Saccharothrix espanaensis]